MSEQRILVLGLDCGLSSNDRRILRKAGILVIKVKYPSSVSYLSSEPVPASSSDMLLAAIQGLASNTLTSGINSKAAAWDTLARLIVKRSRPVEEVKVDVKP